MFNLDKLRPVRVIEDGKIACPVRGCDSRLELQVKTFKRERKYRCIEHCIFVGKTTFEYEDVFCNLLWQTPADRDLLSRIGQHKRENRLARERSEDAVSWNVFRHLQASGRLDAWVASVLGRPSMPAQIHYWSFDEATGATWGPLDRVRDKFGEREGRGSEPDLVISTPDAHIWIEAKFGSSNRSSPSDRDGARSRYTANGWYAETVSSSFDTIAFPKPDGRARYELLRHWLLGSWAAAQDGRRFVLVNLVRKGFEEDVPNFAGEHFKLNDRREIQSRTWESIFEQVNASDVQSVEDQRLLEYMRLKTLGYSSSGKLVTALPTT